MKRERKSGPENGPPFVEYRAGLQIAAAAGLMPAPPVPYGPGVQGKSNLSMGAVSEAISPAYTRSRSEFRECSADLSCGTVIRFSSRAWAISPMSTTLTKPSG